MGQRFARHVQHPRELVDARHGSGAEAVRRIGTDSSHPLLLAALDRCPVPHKKSLVRLLSRNDYGGKSVAVAKIYSGWCSMVSHLERSEPFWPLWRKHSPRLFAICLREMNCNWAD